MDGFIVDTNALISAGQGIRDLMGKLDQTKVENINCEPVAVGHAGLSGSLASFCDRWQVGVENMVGDSGQLAQRLLDSATAYQDWEAAVVRVMDGGFGA